MSSSGLEHVKGFAKGEVAHDIEAEEVAPFGHVDRFDVESGKLVDEQVGIFDDAAFVTSQSW